MISSCLDGIKRAKAEGRYRGRLPTIDPAQIAELKVQGLGASAIAKKLGIARASVYRVKSATGQAYTLPHNAAPQLSRLVVS